MTTKPFDPGRLRVPFTLEQWSSTPDGHGGQADIWTPVTTIWGAIDASRPSDPVRAGDEEQVIQRTIVVRADPRVEPAMRLVGEGGVFIIDTVHDADMTDRYLRCVVTSQVPS